MKTTPTNRIFLRGISSRDKCHRRLQFRRSTKKNPGTILENRKNVTVHSHVRSQGNFARKKSQSGGNFLPEQHSWEEIVRMLVQYSIAFCWLGGEGGLHFLPSLGWEIVYLEKYHFSLGASSTYTSAEQLIFFLTQWRVINGTGIKISQWLYTRILHSGFSLPAARWSNHQPSCHMCKYNGLQLFQIAKQKPDW